MTYQAVQDQAGAWHVAHIEANRFGGTTEMLMSYYGHGERNRDAATLTAAALEFRTIEREK